MDKEGLPRHGVLDLPNEVLLRILGYLSIETLCPVRSLNRRLFYLCDHCPIWRSKCMDLCGSNNTCKLPFGEGWRSLYLLMKVGERCRKDMIPQSTIWQRRILRPAIIMVLILLLPTAIALDVIVAVRNRVSHRGRLYRLCMLIAQVALCLTSVPLLTWYFGSAMMYAYYMRVPLHTTEELERLRLSEFRARYVDHIPSAILDHAEGWMTMTRRMAVEADDWQRKTLAITSIREELCLTFALLWDIGQWWLGRQDEKLARFYR